MTWYWISLSYATFGIACDSKGIVTTAAPIGKWMVGKDIAYCKQWIGWKKGKVIMLGEAYER